VSDDVTAVVLVGGRSTRMGRDKALILVDGTPLAAHVVAALSPFAAHVLLAGRPLPGLDVPAITDQYPDAGPLGGIASALAAVQTPLALVAACDMPSIRPALLALLLDAARADPAAAAVMCRSDGGLEPLLSAWRPALALAPLRAALDSGTRSLREAVAALPHAAILPPARWRPTDPPGDSFRNWNTPTDLPTTTTLL
jgi:molybdopterin-guanine dinucleotide biosynthesis protein A